MTLIKDTIHKFLGIKAKKPSLLSPGIFNLSSSVIYILRRTSFYITGA